MLTHVLFGCLKQLSDGILGHPDGLTIDQKLDAGCAVFGVVEQEVAIRGYVRGGTWPGLSVNLKHAKLEWRRVVLDGE